MRYSSRKRYTDADMVGAQRGGFVIGLLVGAVAATLACLLGIVVVSDDRQLP